MNTHDEKKYKQTQKKLKNGEEKNACKKIRSQTMNLGTQQSKFMLCICFNIEIWSLIQQTLLNFWQGEHGQSGASCGEGKQQITQ
jgi:predicted transcriptional regulator YheO